MICEMCGAVEAVYTARVEGAELGICHKCSSFATILGPVQKKEMSATRFSSKSAQAESEITEMVVSNYSQLLRKKRESLSMTQKQFAQKLNEKESVIHQLESGSMKPSLDMAKKIQRFLGLRLTEEYEERHETGEHTETQSFTMKDFIKKKK